MTNQSAIATLQYLEQKLLGLANLVSSHFTQLHQIQKDIEDIRKQISAIRDTVQK